MADDDDDPQLRSMRAAWRSMPDEDPPQRGLAELMAAARQQAEVMAEARAPSRATAERPTWWKRLAATLLRPPMLALASVLLLLGGLFVVTSSNKGVSPEPTPVEQSVPATTTAPATRDHGEASSGGAAPANAGSAAMPPAAPSAAGPGGSPPVLAPPPARPSPPAHHAAAPAQKLKASERTLDEMPATPPREPAPPPPPSVPKPSAAPAYEDSKDDDADAPRATRGAVTKTPAADVESQTPRQQLDDQLLSQCRAAAKRGDCEVAKQLAKRISNDDAAYYQTHVAGDATIAPCLAPAN
jgi:hypothetical protein